MLWGKNTLLVNLHISNSDVTASYGSHGIEVDDLPVCKIHADVA